MEEAISQLEVLGITRTQAKKALARYNNDVSRAADFIFSGNYISDGEENEIEPTEDPNQQSEALAQSLSLEEQHKPIESTVSNQPTTTNPSDMSLVVYKDSKEAFDQQVPEKNDNVKDSISNFSLTWWKNPENPSERKAIDYIPIGLRPPAYSFNYAPIVVQALFHITYFQFAVASFQPTPPNWGQPANYWKGKGEHVPGYITIKKPRQPKEQNEKRLEGYNDIDETFIQEDLAEDSQEEDVEVKAIPKCLQAIGELQKIFAFLGNTKRAYGSVADFTKALNTKSNLWDEDDIYFESFLDLLINPIVGCDEFSATSLPLEQKLKSMFTMNAKIECGDKCEEEELYYLYNINPESGSTSFYDSLDPLVFESYDSEIDAEYPYKFTSFEKISPLVFIVLENRYKVDYEYRIDKTIYMDRYMHENKDKVIDGFLKMQSYRADINTAQKKIEDLKEKHHGYSKGDLLNETLMYFRGKEGSDKETDLLLSVIEDIQQNISDSLQKHESLMKAQKKEIYSVFDRDDMKIKPYTLRATFHHDGKSGTGHYWAYIWVEEVGGNLLDVSSEGGWFKFCDAQVTPAKEEDLFNDPIPPFSLMYIDESLPKFTKAQIYKQLPEELKEFVRKDNEMFEQELHSYSQPFSTSYPVYDEQWTTEKTEEYQIEQATFDDSNSTGTAVGQANTEAETPKFMGNGYTKLKEQANRKILDVSSYSCDDYRILMSFEVFLAKTQNQQGLEHLYLLYLSGPDENGNQTVNEMGSRYDEYLKFAWDQYQYLQNLGQKVSRALCHFVRREHQLALRAFLEVKRTEVSWKTQIMLNLDLHAYSSIDVISFRPLCELYGKKCLEILNRQAFNKALNISYRSRGLEDALRIAHQAHAMIGPDAISTDDTYASMRELWLSFGEQGNNDKLTSIQTDLLNTLVMTYLEGQSGQSVDPMDKTEVPNADIDEKPEEMSPWMYYKQICEEAKEALSKVEL